MYIIGYLESINISYYMIYHIYLAHKKDERDSDIDNSKRRSKTADLTNKGTLQELNQMVNPRVNHLVKCRRVARDPNPRLKLT